MSFSMYSDEGGVELTLAEESESDEQPGRVAQSDVRNRTGAMGLRSFRRIKRCAALRDFSWFMVKLKEPRGRSFRQTTSPRSIQATATHFPLLLGVRLLRGSCLFFVGSGFTLPTILPRSAMPMPEKADYLCRSQHMSEMLQTIMVRAKKSGEIHRRITSMLHEL